MIFALADEAIEASAVVYRSIGLGAFADCLHRLPKLDAAAERIPATTQAASIMQRAHVAFGELHAAAAELASPMLPEAAATVLLSAGLVVNLAERAARGGTFGERQAERYIAAVRAHVAGFAGRGMAA
jgi:hypothetical protein